MGRGTRPLREREKEGGTHGGGKSTRRTRKGTAQYLWASGAGGPRHEPVEDLWGHPFREWDGELTEHGVGRGLLVEPAPWVR